MSTPNDGYRDDARQGHVTVDNNAKRDEEAENLEAVDQDRRDRLSDYADHDWSAT